MRTLAAVVAGELTDLSVGAGTFIESLRVLLNASGERCRNVGSVRLSADSQVLLWCWRGHGAPSQARKSGIFCSFAEPQKSNIPCNPALLVCQRLGWRGSKNIPIFFNSREA